MVLMASAFHKLYWPTFNTVDHITLHTLHAGQSDLFAIKALLACKIFKCIDHQGQLTALLTDASHLLFIQIFYLFIDMITY